MLSNSIKSRLLKCTCWLIQSTKSRSSLASEIERNQSQIINSNYDYDTRILKVAVIGVPNAGKSTFINNLIDRKVCPTSSKVHTTRQKAMAVFTHHDAQIVFLDTPGLVNYKERQRFNLERTFRKDCDESLKQADVIGVIHDVANSHTREVLDIKLIKLLEKQKEKPSFLVLNKVDVLKSKRKLLDLTKILTENHIDNKPIPGPSPDDAKNKGWPCFKEIFMVSSLLGDGLNDVKSYLFHAAKPGKWMFPEEICTDQSAEAIIKNTVKATLLNFLPQEIPYQLTPELEYFDISESGKIDTVVIVHCPSERIAKLVSGGSDGKLRQMTQEVQTILQDAFQNIVRIRIIMTPKSNKK